MNTEETLDEIRSLLEVLVEEYFVGEMAPDEAFGATCLALNYLKALEGDERSKKSVQFYEKEPEYFPFIIPSDEEIDKMIDRLNRLKENALEQDDERHVFYVVVSHQAEQNSTTTETTAT